ncbi:unnamed protein product [Anisakis simplex]|uniref:Vitellogenin n=1 Tax=Anisakis simplex TaxID=6269 RepID=A0A0M3K663_ANISI|nr:unnamed protein product [Anisakis simplex]
MTLSEESIIHPVTMKLYLLLALCAVAIATRRDWNDEDVRRQEVISEEHVFRPQRLYRYLYRGQISNGLPRESTQHAASRIEAQVVLAFPNTERTAVLQIDKIRFADLNGELPEPREIQRFDIFDERQIEEEHERVLRLPIRFRYVDGLVSEIEFDREDKPWSENIKRAILNLLQVNLKKNMRTDIREEQRVRDEIELREEREQRRERVDFFTVQEPTLEGDCEVFYTINEVPEEDRETLKVSKSINFDKCRRRIEVRYNHRFGEQCEKCDEESEKERLAKTTSVFTYEIVGNRDRFVISRAEVRSQHVIVPLSQEEITMKSVVVGRLELVNVQEHRERIEEPRSERKQTIVYSPERQVKVERFYMNGDEELREDHPFRLNRHKYELIEQAIQKMIRAMRDREIGIDFDATEQITRLVSILRRCSKQELQRVEKEFMWGNKFEEKVQKKVRDVLIDALGLAGTKNTIEVLVERIAERRISLLKSARALQTLINSPVVSEKQIDMVLRLCKKDVCERNPLLKQSCLLTAGAMINALCKPNKDRLAIELVDERVCPREMKEKYLRELMEMFRNAETRSEKVLALKTIANAGIDLSVYEIENIIMDRQQERIIRTQAIDALRQLRRVMPRKIQRLLMPIFKDQSEHPEIRVNALAQIINTLPERAILEQIADTLAREPSRQVRAFTYTIMSTFAQSKIPYERRLAEDLKIALRLARVEIRNWAESKYMHIPMFAEERRAGLSLDIASIFANDSILPRELMMSIDTLVMRQFTKSNLQLGLVQYNMEQLLERIVKETESKSVEEIVVRGRRDTTFRPTEILRNLFEKLHIRSRREKSNAFAMAYLRWDNLDFAFLPIDAETLPEALQVLRDGKIDVSRLERYLVEGCQFNDHSVMMSSRMMRRVPTTIGLPLVITHRMPTIIGLEGNAKGELIPQRSDRLIGAKIVVRALTKLTTTHHLGMQIWSPILTSGVEMVQNVRLNLPIDAQIEVKYEKKMQLKFKIKIPERRTQIAAVQSRSLTNIAQWPIDPKVFVEPRQRTIPHELRPARVQNIDRTFGQKWLDILVNVRGQYKNCIAAQNSWEVSIEKKRDAPREIVTEIEMELVKENKMKRPELERFYSEKVEREKFEIDDSEDVEEQDRSDITSRNSRRNERKEEEKRREEEERLRHQEFSRNLREYNPQRGYKVKMQMRVKAIGAADERKAELQLETGCDERMRYCMLVANARRVPIFEDEKREWTFRTQIQSLYPEPMRDFKEWSERKHRELNAQIEMEWGCDRKQHITMKIQGEQDREQRELMNRIERDTKQMTAVERYERILRSTILNQYRIVADYEICPVLRSYLNQVVNMLISSRWWNSRVIPTENDERRMFAKITIDPLSHQYVTLRIERPRESVEIRDIRLPMPLEPLMLNIHRPHTPIRSIRHFVRKTVTPEERDAECQVSSRRINTFDDEQIKLPLTTCYSVLAKDCSSEEPRFAVLMKKIAKDSEEKQMKIIDEERVIELRRVHDEIEVRINGRVERDAEKLERVGINNRDDIVIVELEDVTVRFDGVSASIKMSPLFKNVQCGICGHYDDEARDEYRKADNELTNDLEQYHRSYLNRDDECEIDEEVISKKDNYRVIRDDEERLDESSEEEREVEKPVMRTHVIEYNHETCFSMKGVPECPRGTYARESQRVPMKVSFACISRSSPNASRLADRARTEVIKMDKQKPSFVDTIMVPRRCLVF